MKILLAILFLAGFGGQVPTTAQISTFAKYHCNSYNGYGRNSIDCTKWFRCVFGKPVPMGDCTGGTVFSLRIKGCAKKDSGYDDCTSADKNQNHNNNNNIPTTTPTTTTTTTTTNNNNNNIPTTTPTTTTNNNNKIHEKCDRFKSKKLDLPKSDNCAQFYNCSLTPRAPEPGYLGDYVDECPYPKLFSEILNRCEDFESVNCGRRKIIKYACNYEKLRCPTLRCKSCALKYPDCRGRPEGYNTWEQRLNSSYFAICYKERGFPAKCRKNYFFSPVSKECVLN